MILLFSAYLDRHTKPTWYGSVPLLKSIPQRAKKYWKGNVPKGAFQVHLRHAITKMLNGANYMFGQRMMDDSSGLKPDEIYSLNMYWASGLYSLLASDD